MSWLSEFLHPGRAYAGAGNQLARTQGKTEDIYSTAQNYLLPFMGYGQNAYGNLSGAMSSLLDPQALQDKWISGYKESEAAKNLENMATERGLNAAQAQGILGSTPTTQAIQAGTSQIAAADRQQYLDDLMKKYLSGAGIAQNIFGTGANAADRLSGNSMSMAGLTSDLGQQQAGLNYGQNSAGGGMFRSLLGAGIGLAGSALGGPIGGALAKRWNLAGA